MANEFHYSLQGLFIILIGLICIRVQFAQRHACTAFSTIVASHGWSEHLYTVVFLTLLSFDSIALAFGRSFCAGIMIRFSAIGDRKGLAITQRSLGLQILDR